MADSGPNMTGYGEVVSVGGSYEMLDFDDDMGTVNHGVAAIAAALQKVQKIIAANPPVWQGSAADQWVAEYNQWASSCQALLNSIPNEQPVMRQAYQKQIAAMHSVGGHPA